MVERVGDQPGMSKPSLVFDSSEDEKGCPFEVCYSELALVGGCDACGEGKGWATLIGLPNKPPFIITCKKCARELLSLLLHRFLKIRKGDRPVLIDPEPITRGKGNE